MKTEAPRQIQPSLTLNSDLLMAMALEYCAKLPHFKSKTLTAKLEVDDYHEDAFTGNIVVSVYEGEDQ